MSSEWVKTEIANARHFPNVEQPDAFNKIMMAWLWAQR